MNYDDAINDAIRMVGMAPTDVWSSYWAIDGNLGADVLQRQLTAGRMDGANRVLVESLNSWFVERATGARCGRAAY